MSAAPIISEAASPGQRRPNAGHAIGVVDVAAGRPRALMWNY